MTKHIKASQTSWDERQYKRQSMAVLENNPA